MYTAAALSEELIALSHNPVSYVMKGGALLPKFLEQPASDDFPSQLWVASTIVSAVGTPPAGLSRLAPPYENFLLKDLLESAPELFLGAGHYRHFGASPGFLLKLLDSRERLLLQTHPDAELARTRFSAPCGKTEAWYVVEAEKNAAVYCGFKKGVTADKFRTAVETQKPGELLSFVHRLPVKKGDIVFIEPGMPHALGSGCLVAEIQEPSDITVRAERRRPVSGELLDETMLHLGKGMDVLMECFNFTVYSESEIRKKVLVAPRTSYLADGIEEIELIGSAQTSCFSMKRIFIKENFVYTKRNPRITVSIVLRGRGRLAANGKSLPVRQSSETFIPAGIKTYSYYGESDLEVIECYPPEGATK